MDLPTKSQHIRVVATLWRELLQLSLGFGMIPQFEPALGGAEMVGGGSG
jgi:hypothetical protein